MRANLSRQALLVAALAAAQASAPVLATASERIPVVGADGPQEDACGGIGRVFTLDETLPVMEEPDQYGRKKDDLARDTLVWLCEGGGEWQGIVYPSGEFQDLGDCQVSSPIAQQRPYAGPCRHGWVVARNLRLVAG